jgi:hypothetical protein
VWEVGSVLDNKFASDRNNVDRCLGKLDVVEKLWVQGRARLIALEFAVTIFTDRVIILLMSCF